MWNSSLRLEFLEAISLRPSLLKRLSKCEEAIDRIRWQQNIVEEACKLTTQQPGVIQGEMKHS